VTGTAERAWQGRSIASKGLQSIGFRGVEILAQVLLVAVTARFLGPSGRGLYALAALAAALFVIPLGSVWSVLALDLAKRRRELPALLSTALVIALAGGSVVALLGGVASLLLGDRWWVVALPAAITPALLFLTYAQGFYQALGHVAAFHTVRVARIVSPLLFISAALALDGGIRTVLACWAVSFVVLVPPVLAHLLWIAGRPGRPAWTLRPYLRAVAAGGRFLPGNAALALDLRVALPVLAALSTTTVVGVYSVAVSVAELLRLGSRALYIGAFADIGGRSPAAAATLTARAIRHSLLLAVVASAAVIPASALLLGPIVGPGYGEVPLVLALLMPAIVALSAFPTLTAYFSVQLGRPEAVTVASVLLVGVSVGAMVAFAGPLDAANAAIATSIGAVVGVTYLALAFLRVSGSTARALLPGAAELADYLRLARALHVRRPRPIGVPTGTSDA
jgi:O-antigen/teichoic acid export membrane protein